MSVKITPEELAKSAARNRAELIKMPVLSLKSILPFVSLRTGIRYAETVGELSGDIELGPYDEDREDDESVNIKGRTLYTYFGNAVKKFSPNSVVSSIYGSNLTKGDGLKSVDIVTQVVSFLTGKIGQGLAQHLFDAVRDDTKKTTKSLFNGFDTILRNEIAAGAISEALGNLFVFEEAITSDNAVDQIVAYCRAANDLLLGLEDGEDAKGDGLNLFVPRSVLYAYRDDYKATTGHSPIYDKFNQTTVEGFPNIHFVPVAGKATSDIIQLTPRKNSLIGVNQTGDEESIAIEKHHPFKLDFIATLFFGTQYESISPERLLVGKLKTKAAAEPIIPEQEDDGNDEDQ